MKQILVPVFISILAFGCNNTETAKENAPVASASTEKIDYAYLPEGHPADYWERGDQKNTALVLKSLKAFENGNIDECMEQFADSIQWRFDGYDAKISKDSMRAMLKGEWQKASSIKVNMDDYESVVSKDKKEEYVTLWYKQIYTGKDGKTDSVACVDDLKIENGKITLLDEKTRKFPAKK